MGKLLIGLKFLPMILQAVVAVEQSIKGAPGSTKKEVVLGAIKAGAQAVGKSAPTEDLQVAGALIDQVVTTLNSGGVFTGSTAVAAAVSTK